MLFTLPVVLYAQKDVTQFLGIPIDGNKSEMIQKLKDKGFTIHPQEKDVLDGEFNGTDVNIFIVTNNNKVRRIAIVDAIPRDETNIKIRFNNLIQQFANNNKYSEQADSTLAKYTIPTDEDITYEINVHNKRYQVVFYQKSLKYDSLIKESVLLITKDTLNDEEKGKFKNLISETFEESLKSLNKKVWFMISKQYGGKYVISMYYDNVYNEANGEGL